MALLGAGSLAFSASAAERIKHFAGRFGRNKTLPLVENENLVCIISDLHVRPGKYQEDYFKKTIDDILALNPRPKYVLCLGDVAYLTGKPEEYAAAKQGLDRLEEAGMQVTITMGNHDRRANFAAVFPEKAALAELPHRLVYTVQTPRADFILLDSLQEGDNHDKWITPGAIDDEQRTWLESKLAASTKPVFVMAHHPLNETKIGKILLAAPNCCGYIYGHKHIWSREWIHMNYRERNMMKVLCVPSTGHWGNIGFVTLSLAEDRAVASFHQNGFFFPKPAKEDEPKPLNWTSIEEENQGSTCTFPLNRMI